MGSSFGSIQGVDHSRKSDALLINGNAEGYGMARCLPMSLLSALLVNSLLQQKSALVLHLFCGAHSPISDGQNGPVLNSQLELSALVPLRLRPRLRQIWSVV